MSYFGRHYRGELGSFDPRPDTVQRLRRHEVQPLHQQSSSSTKQSHKRPVPLPQKETGRASKRRKPDPVTLHEPDPTVRGTGAHDNALAQSRGQYREPSLRYASGIQRMTPKPIRAFLEKHKNSGEQQPTTKQPQLPSPPGSDPIRRDMVNPSRDALAPSQDWEASKSNAMREVTSRLSTQSHDDGVSDMRGRPGRSDKVARETVISDGEKISILGHCIRFGEAYVLFVEAESEASFWGRVLGLLETRIQKLFDHDCQQLQRHVDSWCEESRQKLKRRGETQTHGQSDLQESIDSWNKIWVQAFCRSNRRLFRLGSTSPQARSEILAMVRNELSRLLDARLHAAEEKLAEVIPNKEISSSLSLEHYRDAVSMLAKGFRPTAQASLVRETRALMRLVADLSPQLVEVLEQHMAGVWKRELALGTAHEQETDLRDPMQAACESSDTVIDSIEKDVELTPRAERCRRRTEKGQHKQKHDGAGSRKGRKKGKGKRPKPTRNSSADVSEAPTHAPSSPSSGQPEHDDNGALPRADKPPAKASPPIQLPETPPPSEVPQPSRSRSRSGVSQKRNAGGPVPGRSPCLPSYVRKRSSGVHKRPETPKVCKQEKEEGFQTESRASVKPQKRWFREDTAAVVAMSEHDRTSFMLNTLHTLGTRVG